MTALDQLSDKDRLVTRPADSVPTTEDRTNDVDPKPAPEDELGNDPNGDDIGYVV
jgi:hypothetical protein